MFSVWDCVREERLRFWSDPDTKLKLAKDTGVQVFRMGVDWSRIMPEEPLSGLKVVRNYSKIHFSTFIYAELCRACVSSKIYEYAPFDNGNLLSCTFHIQLTSFMVSSYLTASSYIILWLCRYEIKYTSATIFILFYSM